MSRFIAITINVLLFPVTLLLFLMPVLIYFVPFWYESRIVVIASILVILWIGVFLSSLVFLSSYCGFLCPITKIFNLVAYLSKNQSILKHRFPKTVGTIVEILWIAGTLYVFIRFVGNIFVFLPHEPIFSQAGLLALFFLYGLAAIVIKTDIGKDELGHYLCPFSPLIKAGIELNAFFKLPGFRIVPLPHLCRRCGLCNKSCSYQNNVMGIVHSNKINYKTCSNCGKCIKACKQNAIQRVWS